MKIYIKTYSISNYIKRDNTKKRTVIKEILTILNQCSEDNKEIEKLIIHTINKYIKTESVKTNKIGLNALSIIYCALQHPSKAQYINYFISPLSSFLTNEDTKLKEQATESLWVIVQNSGTYLISEILIIFNGIYEVTIFN